MREHKDPKLVGAQATSTIKQLSLLEFQVQRHSCVAPACVVCSSSKGHTRFDLAVQAQRHLLAKQANAEDQSMYEAKQAQLDHDIQAANARLDRSKDVLQAARQEKKRKLQYEVTPCPSSDIQMYSN